MPNGNGERRAGRRVAAKVPVSVKLPGSENPTDAVTRDMSTTGIFFYTDSQIEKGSSLEMVLVLPPELTGGERRWVCCQASVVRVDESGPEGRQFGVAASIERMEALTELLS